MIVRQPSSAPGPEGCASSVVATREATVRCCALAGKVVRLKALVDVWSPCQTWSIGVCSVSVSGLLSSVQSASARRHRSRPLPRNNRDRGVVRARRPPRNAGAGSSEKWEGKRCSRAVNSRPGLAVQYCLAPERRAVSRRACTSRDRWCLAAAEQLRDRG